MSLRRGDTVTFFTISNPKVEAVVEKVHQNQQYTVVVKGTLNRYRLSGKKLTLIKKATSP